MLVDLPEGWERKPVDPVIALFRLIGCSVDGTPIPTRRLAQGVYEGHLNLKQELAWAFVERWDEPRFEGDWETRPQLYGVCDDWEQIVGRWPELETDPRPFVLTLTPIIREEEPESGGWRWHKWGLYIGRHEPQHEYLYDETKIDKVYVFSINLLGEEHAHD